MRICSGIGCGRAVEDGKRYCSECDTASPSNVKTHSPAARDSGICGRLYSMKRWQWNRNEMLRLFPICCHCAKSLSALTDHIVPAVQAVMQVAADPRSRLHWPYDPSAGFYVRQNLWCLCRHCHALKSGRDAIYAASGQQWPSIMDAYDSKTRVECTWLPDE